MNDRERWVAAMHYQPVDHVPDEEFGYWTDTFPIWHKQGLPRYVTNNKNADRYFGFARRKGVGVNVGLRPHFRRRVLERHPDHEIIVDANGVKCIIHSSRESSIPHYLEFPLKNRQDWLTTFKPRLDPKTPARYPADWDERKKEWATRDYPLGISCGSLYGWIRNWMGFENAAMCFYDDPDLMDEMMEHLTNLTISVIAKAVTEVKIDCAAFWEDMAFNNGPMISPALFRRFMAPRYKRITDFLKQHGVDVVYLDCDGDISLLVEAWLEAGVNCMFPVEVRAGSDPVALRQRYGKACLLMGGVEKVRLREGRAAIRQEIARIENTVADGGYIPHVDHRCPPDVPYQDYLYYLEVKRRAFGIPTPERGEKWAKHREAD